MQQALMKLNLICQELLHPGLRHIIIWINSEFYALVNV